MNRYTTLILLLLFLGFSSCKIEDSADVNQDNIWVKYELIYNSSDSVIFALAEFRLKGSDGDILQLNEAASVQFNNQELQFNELYDAHILELNELVDSGAFVYTDLDQFTFTNTVVGIDSIGFNAEFDTLYKTQTNTVEWIGNPIQESESVSVYLENWTLGNETNLTHNAVNATILEIPQSELLDIANDSISISIMRKADSSANQSTSVGGMVSTKFIVSNHIVQVVN